MNAGKPVQFQVQNPQFKGDLIEGFYLLTAGDSAIFKISVDSLLKANAAPPVDFMKPGTGQMLVYHTTLVSVKTSEQMEKEKAENTIKQVQIDEKLLQEYFTKNKIKATKTESGLYYKIDKEGNGIKANTGDTVVVNYTGMTMDGKKFDSNVDPQFMHMEPFTFPVGLGMVIKGWDEGFKIFKKGTKGTLYIPSYLAYGDRSPDPSKIPNNGILLFDIEMVDVKPAAAKN
jgi:FKBP-type peptidyl-prolyl cis-trans isomerase